VVSLAATALANAVEGSDFIMHARIARLRRSTEIDRDKRRWRMFANRWPEVTRYDARFHVAVSVGSPADQNGTKQKTVEETSALTRETTNGPPSSPPKSKRDEFFFTLSLIWLAV
jgi:hypothetical protein